MEELSIDSAAEAFGALLEPPKEEKAETPADKPADTPAVEETPPAENNEQDEGGDITVQVDGKDVKLTKAEVAEAIKARSSHDELVRKTEKADNAKTLADAETRKAQQERQTYSNNLQKMASTLESLLEVQSQTNWDDLLKSDPVEFLKQKHLFDQRQALLNKNQQEQVSLQQTFQAEEAKRYSVHLEEQQRELLAKLPEWSDEAKAKTEKEDLKKYLVTLGYDEASVRNITDHRAVIIGRKAMLYDQMMAKAQAAAKKVQNLPTRVERPGVTADGAPDGRTQAMRNHAKSGTLESATAVFASLLQ